MSLRVDVARQAYVWGLPTVALYGVLHEQVLAPAQEGRGSRFDRVLTGPIPARVAGLSGLPAVGTPFCVWLDLRGGPVRLEVPPGTVVGSAAVTLLDLYAEVVGQVPEDLDPSRRAVLLAGPSWGPTVPADVVAVLRCPTDLCLAVGRDRSDDGPGPGRPQALAVRPADGPGGGPLPRPVPPVDLRRPPTPAFLTVLDWMLPLMPTRPGEEDLRTDLEVVGVACGPAALADAVAEDRIDGAVTEGLRLGFEDVRQAQMSSSSRPRRTASWARATESLR